GAIVYRPGDAPREIRRRIARRAVLRLASERGGADLRGRELDQLLAVLVSGRKAALRGVLCSGGPECCFIQAPARNAQRFVARGGSCPPLGGGVAVSGV